MKRNVFVKILTVILATTMFISGSFLMSNDDDFIVHADTNIPSSFIVNGVKYLSTATSLLTDEDYVIPEWLYLARYQDNFDDVYNDWKSAVVNGVLNSQNLYEFYETAEPNLNTFQRNILGYGVGKTIAGGGNEHTKSIIKKFLGSVAVTTVASVLVKTLGDLGSKLWTTIKGVDPTAEVTSQEFLHNGLDGTYENVRNYFKGVDQWNNYNTGSTNVQPIYDYNTSQFYDIVHNNQQYVTNYTYDFNNNMYDFTTDTGYQYKLQNSTKYAELQSVINGVTNTYRQYFMLPNGDNSYNLTEDEIYGLKLDFNVQQYNSVYDYDNLKALYHFDGDNSNSAYGTNSDVNPNLGQSFAYVNEIWDGAVYLKEIRDGNSPSFFVNSPSVNDYFRISFRFMPSMINDFSFQFFDSSSSYAPSIVYEIGDYYIDNVTYDYVNSYQNLDTSAGGYTNKQIINVSSTASQAVSQGNCRQLGGNPKGTYIDASSGTQNYITPCEISVNASGQNSYTTSSWKQYFANTRTDHYNYNGEVSFINYEQWNYFSLYKSYGGSIYLDINSMTWDLTEYFNNYCNFKINFDNYCLIDELSYYRNNSYIDFSNIYYLPKDTNQTYVLPTNIPFDNNLILLKTKYTIHDWQIGGKRSSNPTSYDVYFSVDENGTISSVQQYVNGNWISIDGAIYNSIAGKFVNIIGYSVIAGNEQFIDIGVDDTTDGWLSTTINEIKAVIISGFNTVNEKLDELLRPKNSEKDSVMDKVNDIENASEFLDEEQSLDLDTQLDTDIDNITQLSTITDSVFDVLDDNGLQIIYTAPLIVLLLRLII